MGSAEQAVAADASARRVAHEAATHRDKNLIIIMGPVPSCDGVVH